MPTCMRAEKNGSFSNHSGEAKDNVGLKKIINLNFTYGLKRTYRVTVLLRNLLFGDVLVAVAVAVCFHSRL